MTLELTRRATDPLPVLTGVRPSDFLDLDYSETLLLAVPFDRAITNDQEYVWACQEGFQAYFELMWDWNEQHTKTIFLDRLYSRSEVIECVIRDVLGDPPVARPSLCWRAGFVLGWVSALSLTDPVLAQMGKDILISLVQLEQRQKKLRPSVLSKLARSVGLAGCALDM